jgi:hypothetical protein
LTGRGAAAHHVRDRGGRLEQGTFVGFSILVDALGRPCNEKGGNDPSLG